MLMYTKTSKREIGNRSYTYNCKIYLRDLKWTLFRIPQSLLSKEKCMYISERV